MTFKTSQPKNIMTLVVTAEPVPLKIDTDGIVRVGKTCVTLDIKDLLLILAWSLEGELEGQIYYLPF